MADWDYSNRFYVGHKVSLVCDLNFTDNPIFGKEKFISLPKGTKATITFVDNTTAMTDSLQMVRYTIILENGSDSYNGIPEVYLEFTK